MIKLVTYADGAMTISQSRCVLSGLKNGIDEAIEMRPADIAWWFNDANKDVLSKERGAGYWLWKPYSIYTSILQMNEGDILIYSDAGIEFIAPVHEIISRMTEDIFFFTNGWKHGEWCKMDVIDAILKDDQINKHEVTDVRQIQASVIFLKVNQQTRDFVKEWLLYCQMPGFIDDSPSKLPNYPTFAEHRHDQAILTCCAIKHGYTIDHWWPTTYSYHLPRTARDSYPVMFNHHRKRNAEW